MNELYTQLGLIEANITALQNQLKLLKVQKNYLIKTIEDYADQSVYQNAGGEDGVGIESATDAILDKSTNRNGTDRTDY